MGLRLGVRVTSTLAEVMRGVMSPYTGKCACSRAWERHKETSRDIGGHKETPRDVGRSAEI